MLIDETLNLNRIKVQRTPLYRLENNHNLSMRNIIIPVNLIIMLIIMTEPINASDCMPYQKIDDNDLTINDIVINGMETDLACVKARFALAFKIEEKQTPIATNNHSTTTNDKQIASKVTIGYVRIGNALHLDRNCPKDDQYNTTSDKTKSFLMTVDFECGTLQFIFERDDQRYSVSRIYGTIRFGSSNLSQNIDIDRRMFITSDLKRHFYCPDKIEVDTKTSESSKYEIQANFWNSEFETFRLTPEDRFILPKDEDSTPIENGPKCPMKSPEKKMFSSNMIRDQIVVVGK